MKRKMCPYNQKECMGDQCILWGEETCLFVEQLKLFSKRKTDKILEYILYQSELSNKIPKDDKDSVNRILSHFEKYEKEINKNPAYDKHSKEKNLDEQNLSPKPSEEEMLDVRDIKKTVQSPKHVAEQDTEGDTIHNPKDIIEEDDKEERWKSEDNNHEILDEELKKKSKDELLKLMEPTPISEFDVKIPGFETKSDLEIAQELADFCLQKKPNVSRWHDFHFLREMFWEGHEPREYPPPAEFRLKINEIEQMAEKIINEKKIPDFLKDMTIDELANEFVENNDKVGIWGIHRRANHGRLKGIDIYELPHELQDKIERAQDRAKELLDEQKNEEMKKKARELIPDLINWCREKHIQEITPLCVNVFVYEKNLKLPIDAQMYLHFYAMQKYNPS